MRTSILLVALVAFIVNVDAFDEYEDAVDWDQRLYDVLMSQDAATAMRPKRARFCLKRDMTCPPLKNKKDFCCRGSQCACNIFGQNCK